MTISQGLDPFYPIFDSADWLERLLPLGIKLVQLRVKNLTGDELRDEILRAKNICDEAECQLVLNDYWQLAIELGCNYIHLGQEDLDNLDAADITAIKAAGIHIGISTHSTEELQRALNLKPDYIALGPVYPTILKQMSWGPQGLERVSEWKRQIGTLPLIGIGGLNLDRGVGVLEAGADVASLVTDITLSTNPEAQVESWLALTEPFRTKLKY